MFEGGQQRASQVFLRGSDVPPGLDVFLQKAEEARDGRVFVGDILRTADDDLGPAQIERDLAPNTDAECLADRLGQCDLPLARDGGDRATGSGGTRLSARFFS